MKLDDIDKEIISILRQNARTANTTIAKQVGLTEGAVRHRIEQLVKNGAIRRFTIDTSGESGFFAIVMTKARDDPKKAIKEILATKIAKEIYEVSGDFDGCLIIEGESIDAIDDEIDKIRRLKSVSDTKTYIVLRKW